MIRRIGGAWQPPKPRKPKSPKKKDSLPEPEPLRQTSIRLKKEDMDKAIKVVKAKRTWGDPGNMSDRMFAKSRLTPPNRHICICCLQQSRTPESLVHDHGCPASLKPPVELQQRRNR
jgi:hypothetical protein